MSFIPKNYSFLTRHIANSGDPQEPIDPALRRELEVDGQSLMGDIEAESRDQAPESSQQQGSSSQGENASREITGLWSDAYSGSGRSSDFYQPEPDTLGRRKYDLPVRYGPRRGPKETTLNVRQLRRSDLRESYGTSSPMSVSEILTVRPPGAPKGRGTISRLFPCPCFAANSDSESDDDAQSGRLWGPSRRPSLERAARLGQEIPIPDYVHRIIEYTHFLIPRVDKIYAASYYWGRIDRFKAEQLLEGKPEGAFLLRDSAQSEYLYSVSFRRFQRTLHARIEQGRNLFSFDILDESVFSATNVTDLIDNYKDPTKILTIPPEINFLRCLFFEPQLSNPVPRNFVFSLQELCRAKIATTTSYPDVSNLNLPLPLKGYIRELHYSVPVRTLLTTHE